MRTALMMDANGNGGNAASALLRLYLKLESASGEMLQAARIGDWDSVCRLEAACAVVVARLRGMAAEQPLRADEQQERVRILRSILANDAEIRRIVEPQPAVLERGWQPARRVTLH